MLSAVNLTEGGPLTVLQDFVRACCERLPPEWELVVFVHDRRLIDCGRARCIEIPAAKSSWLLRIWIEFVGFRRHARRLAPDLWISLHDTSPSVGKVPQVVYCHNAVPFFRIRGRDVLFQPKLLAFRAAYGWLYRINLKRNRAIVVQQSWMRNEFRRWTRASQDIVVAYPSSPAQTAPAHRSARSPGRATFLYPSLARPFKNLELVGRAVELLERDASWRSEVVFTVDGTENRYSAWLKRRFARCASIRFAGLQSREGMRKLYETCDCLLFPSRMESWGLPITEARQMQLPMLIADLPYAKEAVGTYEAVSFVGVDDHVALARKMLAFQLGSLTFEGSRSAAPQPPFARGWGELVEMLVRYASK